MQTINQIFHGRLGVAEALAKSSSRIVGYRSTGVSWGNRFSETRGADGRLLSRHMRFDPDLVTVSYSQDSIIYGSGSLDLLDAPQKTSPFKGSPIPIEEVNQLGKDVTNLLADSICAKFMTALLKQIGSDTGRKAFSDNAIDIFNEVGKQGGFGRRQGNFTAEGGGTVGNGDAFININRNIDFATADNPFVSAANGRQLLHELLHVASKTSSSYSHYEMARAAWEVATAQGFKGIGSKPSGGDPGGRDDPNSYVFDRILFQTCNPNRRK